MQEIWDNILDWGRNNLTEWTMSKVYIGCAIAGGTVILGQAGLNLFGLGGDADVDPDVDVDDIEGADNLNFLSIRALSGFVTMFGLVGWGGTASGWNPLGALAAAFSGGMFVMLLVALIMRFFRRLHFAGNIQPASVVGSTALVYLRVPAERRGKGKITVSIQGRSMQFDAFTKGEELPTGAECRVLRMTTEGTFEVAVED